MLDDAWPKPLCLALLRKKFIRLPLDPFSYPQFSVRASALVYTVGFGEEAGKPELQGISRETGGTFWLAGARNLGSIFLDSGSLCTNTSTTKRVADGFTGGLQNGARRFGQTGRKASQFRAGHCH